MYNLIIRIICYFTKPINGDPNEWLERPYKNEWKEFNCGSCRGIYRVKNREFEILAVHNTKKNKDFDKTLEFFAKSSKNYNMPVSFLCIQNPKFMDKLKKMEYNGTKEKMTKTYN